jgi:hypothetical protein
LSDEMTISGKAIESVEATYPAPPGSPFTIGGSDLERGKAYHRIRWIDFNGVSTAASITGMVHGELDDGRFVAAEVGGPDAAHASRRSLTATRIFDYRPAGWGRPAWLFALANFKLGDAQRYGRHGVHESKSDGSASWYRDTTSFSFAGRIWFVCDLLDPKTDKDLREFRKHWMPIASAELWTDRRDGDDPNVIDLQARDIANLLSFASGHCVRWLDRVDIGGNGKVTSGHKPSIWCAAAKEGGNGPLDVSDPHQLTLYMERAGAVVSADQDWWARTLELHLQGMLSDIIDVRLTFFYVLMDRISSRVLNTKFPPQIDPNLNRRLARRWWSSAFRAVMRLLTPAWTSERTDQLIQTIKQWNAEPSFTKCVQLAATHFGLPEPHGRLIGGRNPVVHDGDLPSKLPPGTRHSGDLARSAEALVTTVLLRMLNFDGQAYLPDAGGDYLPISPWPMNRACPWTSQPSATAATKKK